MPAKLPRIDTATRNKLSLVGGQIRLHRKELKVTATATAEVGGHGKGREGVWALHQARPQQGD